MNGFEGLTSSDVRELAEARELSGARAVLRRVQHVRDKTREAVETRPKMSDGDIRADFRYQLGYLAALNDVLTWPDKAAEYIRQLPGNEI